MTESNYTDIKYIKNIAEDTTTTTTTTGTTASASDYESDSLESFCSTRSDPEPSRVYRRNFVDRRRLLADIDERLRETLDRCERALRRSRDDGTVTRAPRPALETLERSGAFPE